MKIVRLGIVLCMTILFFGGCITKSVTPKTPEPIIKYSKEVAIKPESFWTDQNLKNSFSKYWGLRFARKTEETFKMEAPYFQVIANPVRYREYIGGFVDGLSEITLSAREQKSERLVVIYFTLKVGTAEVSFIDPWVFAGEQWYHVMQDPIVFPEAN